MEPSEASRIHTETLQIRSYDVDFRKQATLQALCRYFLEAAWNHAERLGVGYAQLERQHQFWVLARLRVQVDVYPAWSQSVTLRTWPRTAKSIFALRDFVIQDAEGRRLAGGSSAWLVLDAASKRPQRVEKLLATVPGLPATTALDRDPEKLPPIKLGPTAALECAVRYSDIDVNTHVNSAQYVGWLMDSYTLDFHRRHWAAGLEVNYVGETLGGESIVVHSEQTAALEFCHSIAKEGGAEVCRARLTWHPTAA